MTQSSGLSAMGPPWSTLTAYDLNSGTIRWQVPNGGVTALERDGHTGTGARDPRGGPVVTASGLIFAATASDHKVALTMRTQVKCYGSMKRPLVLTACRLSMRSVAASTSRFAWRAVTASIWEAAGLRRMPLRHPARIWFSRCQKPGKAVFSLTLRRTARYNSTRRHNACILNDCRQSSIMTIYKDSFQLITAEHSNAPRWCSL
jgi:hypothetical protein